MCTLCNNGNSRLSFNMPIKIHFPLEKPLLDAIIERVRYWCREKSQQQRLAVQEIPFTDEETRLDWLKELTVGTLTDCAALLSLLQDPCLPAPGVTLQEEQVESILRGASAVRLLIRTEALEFLTDEQLESGRISLALIPAKAHMDFLAFNCLAGLQEIFVGRLDPTIEATFLQKPWREEDETPDGEELKPKDEQDP